MDTLNFPTKRNLLLARQRLALARKGYELLDKKRQVLVNELATVQKQAHTAWEALHTALDKANRALGLAYIEMGGARVRRVSDGIQKNASVKVLFRSIMGVELPLVNSENTFSSIKYLLHDTTVSLDEAVLAWKKARQLIISWAGIENTINCLKLHIKKTQKRANALGNITIPLYEARIKFIEERLEERERDELARLKIVKKGGAGAH